MEKQMHMWHLITGLWGYHGERDGHWLHVLRSVSHCWIETSVAGHPKECLHDAFNETKSHICDNNV